MKKTAITVSALLLFVLGINSFAQTNTTSGWTPSFTFRSVVASKYLAFSSGGMLYDKPVVQSDLFVSFQNGLYADVWNSKSFEGSWGKSLGDEVDYGVGYGRSLGKGFSFDIGVTYFDEPMAFTESVGDILYSHIKVCKAFKPVTVFACWENYTTMPGTAFEGGNLYSLGVSKQLNIWKMLSASSSVAMTYDDGGFGMGKGFLAKGSIELDWAITKNLTLIAQQVNFYITISTHDSRDPDAVIFGGFSYKF